MATRPTRVRAGPDEGVRAAERPGEEGGGDGLEDLEVRLLLEGVWQYYGYDFRDYAAASIRRRVRFFMQEEKLPTVSSVQDRVLHDTFVLRRVLRGPSLHVPPPFPGPSFFPAPRGGGGAPPRPPPAVG